MVYTDTQLFQRIRVNVNNKNKEGFMGRGSESWVVTPTSKTSVVWNEFVEEESHKPPRFS